jgi:hypothetical protein
MTKAYGTSLAREYLHLTCALRNGVAAVSGDLAVLTDQILIALNHSADTTFEIDRWARQAAAEQDALDHLELVAQVDDEIACDVCGERPAVLFGRRGQRHSDDNGVPAYAVYSRHWKERKAESRGQGLF